MEQNSPTHHRTLRVNRQTVNAVTDNLKRRVAREAATLLYFGAEKEYKQAKDKAAQTLGTHFLPSNLEIALELDKIAEENEGEKRKDRLVLMRKEALEVMRLLSGFCPVLIGSVWRGTIKQGSDIDLAVYTDDSEAILTVLKAGGVKVQKTTWTTVNKKGATLESFHIYAQTKTKNSMEIVARSREEAGKKRRCETFGDELKGLNIRELEKVLSINPTQQFIPQ
ncbi:MAG TPA: nucleotidyltransferase domain-containing protein [Candidatus Acidoferrales bacterium]|nr:nucleotidyltransferase domain-containing protein [Candidatus Acidoferrales bacterium]